MAEVIKKEPAKKTAEGTKSTAEKTVKPAAKAATKAADDNEKTVSSTTKKQNATGLRIGAVILWLCAIACEVLAILVLKEKLELPFGWDPAYKMILFLVADLIFLVIGSQLWKNANHKDPASKKNKVKWWLWNNMGMIVAAIAFIPFIILTLSDKKADAKTKKIATIAAVIALAIGLLTGHDWNPATQEQATMAEEVLAGYTVYWTSGGSRYHLDQDCSSLSNSYELLAGGVDEAIHNDGHDFLCKFCMNKHLGEIEGIEYLVYGANLDE